MSSDDDKPMVVPPKPKKLKKKVSKKVTSKAPRYSKFLDMAAKEKGHTDSEDVHSEDDRDEPDLSFVVSDDNDTHADDNMLAVYQESLCSQAAALGFGTPISKRRSKERGDQPGAIVCRILEKNERRSKRKLARKVANHDPQSGSPSRPIPGSTIPRSPAALLNCSHHPVLLNSPSALSCLRPPLVVHPTSSCSPFTINSSQWLASSSFTFSPHWLASSTCSPFTIHSPPWFVSTINPSQWFASHTHDPPC